VPQISALVELLLGYPVTPAIKALVAHVANDAGFLRTAPPLVDLPEVDARALIAAFERLG
jgi:4-hydroxy-tetrahydrodipicolinate synthase